MEVQDDMVNQMNKVPIFLNTLNCFWFIYKVTFSFLSGDLNSTDDLVSTFTLLFGFHCR